MKVPGVKRVVLRAVGPLKAVLIARLRRGLPEPANRSTAMMVRFAPEECDRLPQCVTAMT